MKSYKSNPLVVKKPQPVTRQDALGRTQKARVGRGLDDVLTALRATGQATEAFYKEDQTSVKARNWNQFITEVKSLLEPTASEKGYNSTGVDGKNELYEFVANHAKGHALGEIIYKAVRYSRKRDKQDILKIAAWAYLIWKFDHD